MRVALWVCWALACTCGLTFADQKNRVARDSNRRLAVFEAWNTQPGKALDKAKIQYKQSSNRGLAEIKVAPKDVQKAYHALIMNDLLYRYWIALTDVKGHTKQEYRENFGNPRLRQGLMSLDAGKKH